jgi:fatty acid amide hydrolase
MSSYGGLYNLLGYPAGVVSVTRVRAGEETDAGRPGRSPAASRARETEAHSTGLPVAVQIAAPAGQDALVLDVMAVVEEVFCGHPDYPPSTVPAWIGA